MVFLKLNMSNNIQEKAYKCLDLMPIHSSETLIKPCTHDQICIRMQILHICKYAKFAHGSIYLIV